MYLPYFPRVKDQGQTKEGIIVRALGRDKNQGTTKELRTTKKCFLLRLPSLFPLLYLASFYRENSDLTPHLQKVLFLNIAFLKKLSAFLKKLTYILKALPYIPRLYTLHFTPHTRKITLKCVFSCTFRKKSVSLRRKYINTTCFNE